MAPVTPHLLLMDASGFAHRAFHAMSPGYRPTDGEPIGAVLGFMAMGWRMLGAAQDDQPTHAAAVFDYPGKNFRHKLFPAYKANRPPARTDELAKQLMIMRSAAEVLGMRPVEAKGFEADDVIATLAARARRAGMRTTIVSSDKDFGQCVVDGWVEIVDPLHKRRMLEADIIKKMGVPPALVAHLQALCGDAVDNIPGVPGVGKERAAALVRAFGDSEAVLKRAKDARWPQVRINLKRHADQVRLNLRLTTLRRDIKLDVKPSDLTLAPIMKSHLEEILKALGASHRIEEVFALDPQMTRLVPHQADPYAWWAEELKFPGQRLPELPQAGYYRRKLVLGGPFVPARIWQTPELDDEGAPTGQDVMRCDIGGRAKDPLAEWTRLAMNPVPKEKYDFEVADAAHAKTWRPGDPKANPGQAIDLLKQPAPHNPSPKRRRYV